LIHYTPNTIVSIIKKHAPKKYKSILEPSVGDGSLLAPFSKNKNHKDITVTTYDIDGSALSLMKKKYKSSFKKIISNHCDFIKHHNKRNKYDLIIMNPPFSAKYNNWIKYNNERCPIEMAFLKICLTLIKPNGVIIGVFPKSIISGGTNSSISLRYKLLNEFDLKYVYELNNFEFPSIESQFYVVIIKKTSPINKTELRKNNLKLQIKKGHLLSNQFRLDYSFYKSLDLYQKLYTVDFLKHSRLSEFCEVFRGALPPPYPKKGVFHSTDFKNLNAKEEERNISTLKVNVKKIHFGDIVIKRVSRDCISSITIYPYFDMPTPTDCILVIRIKNNLLSPEQLLFTLRTYYSCNEGGFLLQKGTGANFLSIKSLRNIKLPINLHILYSRIFNNYVNSLNENRTEESNMIENNLREYLFIVVSTDNVYLDRDIIDIPLPSS